MTTKKSIMLTLMACCISSVFFVHAWAGPNSSAGCALDMDYTTRSYDTGVTTTAIESSKTVRAADIIWVAVVAQNVADLDTYQVEVGYDPARLQYLSGVEDNAMGGITNFLKQNSGQTVGFQANETTSGNINIANSLTGTNTGQAPEGSGIIALLQFKALNVLQNNSLTVTAANFINSSGVDDAITHLAGATITFISAPPVDAPPTVSNPIADVQVNKNAPNTTIPLANVFNDADHNNASIIKSIHSNSQPALVAATVSGDTLTLDFQNNQSGAATIKIKGTSNGKEVIDTFIVTVTAVDAPPTVSNPIADVQVNEDAPDTTIPLGNLFNDADNNNAAISKSIHSNSQPSLVTATVSGDTLTLNFQDNQSGSATIEIKGTSNGKEVIDTFLVTVTAVDDPPTVAIPIADVQVNENAPNTTISLANVFNDADNNNAAISKSIHSNSHPSLVTATVSEDTLTLNFQDNQSGSATIEITGASNGKEVIDTVIVTVTAVDDPPTVAIPISVVVVDEDASDVTISILNLFNDIDNDNASIIKSIHSNSQPSLVTATVSGDTLTLNFQDNQSGSATIKIKGTSNGKEVIDTFLVTVNPINDPPVAINDSYNTPQGIALSVAAPGVLGNDTDPDNALDTLAAISFNPRTSEGNYIIIKNDGSFVYTPKDAFSGTDTFTYMAHDGTDISNSATVTIIVNSANTLVIKNVSQKNSKNGESKYSGVAVADTILAYLDPGTYLTLSSADERQEALMTAHNSPGDDVISIIELKNMLNHYLHSHSPGQIYNYISSDMESYADDQNRVNQYIMHWLDYEVQGASNAKNHGPAAVLTSSEPNKNGGGADSDYNHWMTIVGYSSDIDPHTTLWQIPNAILNGFVVSDPAVNGLGHYKYIQASEWNMKYFKPVKSNLDSAGIYGAVVEPPEMNKNLKVSAKTPETNPDLAKELDQSKTAYQYRDFWAEASDGADDEIRKNLMKNHDFIKMCAFDHYKQAFNPDNIGRVIKVESSAGDYALILFEKNNEENLVTTGAVMVSLSTGTFKMGFPNPNPDFFDEAKRWQAIYTVYAQTGTLPLNAWPHLDKNNVLDYGHKVVAPMENGSLNQFHIYQVEKDGSVALLDKSPEIELTSSSSYDHKEGWHEIVVKITDDEQVTDVQWPDSLKLIDKNGTAYKFKYRVYKEANIPKVITATDKNYKGSDKYGGISYFFIR